MLGHLWKLFKSTGIVTTQKTFAKKAISKLQAREFFLGFVVKFFNSTVRKDCFSQLKETAQFPYMIWRE